MPISNNILAGSGQATADLGDTIEQSLRFNGSSTVLSRSIATDSAGTTSTFSVWIKLGDSASSTNEPIFTYGGSSYFLISDTRTLRLYGGAAVNCDWTGRTRDYSAWYHVVIQGDGNGNSTNNKCWINGQEISTEFNSRDFPGITQNGGTFRIGSDSGAANWFEGYLADFICVNGSAVDPLNNFGKYNDDGVWVPVDYTGSYGSKGFRLKFDSSGFNGSGGIGADHSGNGNDFTASNGFDTGDVALYSKDTTCSGAGFDASFPVTNAFDGSTSTKAQSGFVNETITFTPATAISYSSQVRVWSVKPSNTASLNGGSGVALNENNWTTIATGSGSITSLAVSGDASRQASLNAVEVDGTVLVDNTDNDVDYFDTPTSNYATFSPIDAGQYIATSSTLSSANLSVTASGTTIAPSTQVIPADGDFYAEFEVVVVENFTFVVGVTNLGEVTGKIGDLGNNYPANSLSISVPGTALFNFGTNTSITVAANQVGTIWGVRYNDGVVTFYRDGVQQQQATISSADNREGLRFFASMASTGTYKANYGQMPFIYRPSGLTDSTELQTNNLPEPTIKNGSDHFRALTGTGANILGIAQGSNTNGTNWNDDVDTGFTSGLWWIKDRDNSSTQHQLVDSVRGGNLAWRSPNTGAETAYVAPTGNSVAWCWNAGGAAVSNTDGTITSSVSANTDAGFSIVSYTGDTTSNQTIGHGLNQAPEFIIFKNLDLDRFSPVYHAGLATPNNEYLILHADDPATAGGGANGMFNNQSPTASVIHVGTALSNTNGNGNDMIAYCWHSVEGYSKFGSYTGNGSTDGPFVYTGFKVGWLLIKGISGSENWRIHDSTRDVSNPAIATLAPNTTTEESVNSLWSIDILSNGFKIRTSTNNFNTSGGNYIYAAFAESPFGGENTPPATAR